MVMCELSTALKSYHEKTLESYFEWQMKRAQTSALSLPCILESESDDEEGFCWLSPAWASLVLSRQVSAVRAGELRDLNRLWCARSENNTFN